MKNNKTVSAEIRKLKRIFKNIEENKRKIVEPLIENVAFMTEKLKELREYIDEHGCTETYQNGANQSGRKRSAEVDVYNTMIKNYVAAMRQLIDLLPEDEKKNDELAEFLRVRKK